MAEEYNNRQENNTQAGTGQKRHVFFTKKKIVLLIVAILIFFEIWDIFINPPAWWRFERQQDKKAILSYVEENYPDAKRLGGEFPLQLPAGPFEPSIMYFELDGINFSIYSQDGKVTNDTYFAVKAEKFIREKYIDDFMKSRGLSPEIKIYFMGGIDVELPNFTGVVSVDIVQKYVDGCSTPNQVGWFYDFYEYWMKNCDLPVCAVTLTYLPPSKKNLIISSYNVTFQKGKVTFDNKDDFYNHFTT